jgi:hypothetical protein
MGAHKPRRGSVFRVQVRGIAAVLLGMAIAMTGPRAHAQGNAAQAWRESFDLLRPRDESNPGGVLSAEEWQRLQDLGSIQRSEAQSEQLRLLLAKAAPAMDQVAKATAERSCDFQLDRRDGFELLLPHLGPMRQASRLIKAQAGLQLADGDMEAFVISQGMLARTASHAGQDEMLIGSLVGTGIGSMTVDQIRAAIDEGRIDQERAQALLESTAVIRGDDPFRYAATPTRELEALQATLQRLRERGDRLDALVEMSGGLAPPELSEVSPRQLLRSLGQMNPIFRQMTLAMRETDPDRAREALMQVDTMIEALKPPAHLLAWLLPSYERALERKLAYAAKAEELEAWLKRLAADPEGAARWMSPALLWSRVAARVQALPEASVDAVELMRTDGPDAAGPLRETALDCLQGCRETIFAAMAQAAAAERWDIDFGSVPGVRGAPPVRLYGGLRGAALLAAATTWTASTDDAIAMVDLAMAVVAALAADPHQSSSCTSLAITRELVPVIRRVARRPDLTPERRERLERAVARVDRGDPFGFRASLNAERSVLRRSLIELRGDQSLEGFHKALRQRPPAWVMAVSLVLRPDDSEPPEASPPLRDVSDLFPIDRMQELARARNDVEALMDPPATDAVARRRNRARWTLLPVVTLRDPSEDAGSAQAVLSQLDAALRGE